MKSQKHRQSFGNSWARGIFYFPKPDIKNMKNECQNIFKEMFFFGETLCYGQLRRKIIIFISSETFYETLNSQNFGKC